MKRSPGLRRTIAVLVVGAVVLAAGCSSSPRGVRESDPTTAPNPSLDVVLNDGGLKLSSTDIRAGRYRVSFRDLRSHRPAGDRVALAFGPSGPRVALLTVPAGGAATGALLANDTVWITVNGAANFAPGGDSLTVDTTRQYPTPAT